MLLTRIYQDMLAQAAWIVGCQQTGEALVIDPNRDVERYVRAADADGLRITHVAETHIHADFVSGARELAARTGARLLLSGEGDEPWRYRLPPNEYGALRGGESFNVGRLRIDVLHTPGHTPEHVSFVLTDTAAADGPMGIFTGDLLFVGDVGRPDLLERTAHAAGTMDVMARQLYASLHSLAWLPDWLQVWPGHGAGSACGKALGGAPSTTLGYERRFNAALRTTTEDAFVATVLAGQPEPPPYFAVMKQVNRDGPTPSGAPNLPRWSCAEIEKFVAGGGFAIDTRSTAQFAEGHLPGTVAVPYGRSFLSYAGTVMPYDQDLALILSADADEADATRMARDLSLIGIERIAGWCSARVLEERTAARRPLGTVSLIEPAAVSSGSAARLIDVRGSSEWEQERIAGAERVFLGELAAAAASLSRSRPIVLACQTGSRSVIGASLLRKAGFTEVSSLAGGLDGWRRAGLALEHS